MSIVSSTRFFSAFSLRGLTSFNFRTLCFLFVFSTCGIRAHALDEKYEEVFVNGEIRHNATLKISNSISVISEELIETRHAKNLEDILNLAPNVNYATGASRGRFIQIRGIGERSQFIDPINPSVGVIVDGIDMTGIATGVTALDSAQIEIFRGPQGTLYGANALAGMINVVGNAPTESFYAKIQAGLGSYGSADAAVTVSDALTEKLAWRLAANKTVSDGFIENDYLNRDDTNNIDELSLRNHIRFAATENLELDLITYIIDVDNGYDAFSLDNNRITLSDQPGHDRQTTYANALRTKYSGWQAAQLDVSLSYADSEVDYGYDEDWSFRTICAEDSECAYWQYSTTDNYLRDNTNLSLDIRLTSQDPQDESRAVKWAAGLYHRQQTVDLLRTRTDNDPGGDSFYLPVAVPELTLYSSEFDTVNSAIYGQLDFTIAQDFTLITGLRFEQRSADFIDGLSKLGSDESLWGGRIALEYNLPNNKLVYGLISRGYKAGGFNPNPTLLDQEREFDTETMVNYELGLKGRWWDDSLVVQVASFYQDRADIQVKKSRADGVIGDFEFIEFIANAATGYNYGVEAELQWYANDIVSLFSSVGLLTAKFDKFINLSHVDRNVDTGEGVDMSGRDQAHAPRYQYLLGGQFDFSEDAFFRLEFEGKDTFYFSESHDKQSRAMHLINVSVGYTMGELELSFWGKNLSDQLVETRGFYFSNDFGNDPRKLYAPETYSQKGAPRTFGVSASYTF
ncbi:MAG: iron complex outermembrane receptor protein [Lentisphaeria bacterium]|jgi:iron complex outermembrane receptor protein